MMLRGADDHWFMIMEQIGKEKSLASIHHRIRESNDAI